DGRYNLLLQGLSRGRVVEEIPSPKLYRIARVELCQDVPAAPGREQELRQALGQGVAPFFSGQPPAPEQLNKLLQRRLALGTRCDVFSCALPLDLEVKKHLLETLDVEARIRHLLTGLEGKMPAATADKPARPFPPEFSAN